MSRDTLALSTPRLPIRRTFEHGILWERTLHSAGYNVELYKSKVSEEPLGVKAQKILSKVSGLVIANYDDIRSPVPLDRYNITQIQFAQRFRLPVFLELYPDDDLLPVTSLLGARTSDVLADAEVIPFYGDMDIIRERLES